MSYYTYATTTRNPKARKDHVCDWCSEPILKGETHFYQSGINTSENEFYQWRSHTECQDALERELGDGDNYDEVSWWESHKRGMTLAETEAAEVPE